MLGQQFVERPAAASEAKAALLLDAGAVAGQVADWLAVIQYDQQRLVGILLEMLAGLLQAGLQRQRGCRLDKVTQPHRVPRRTRNFLARRQRWRRHRFGRWRSKIVALGKVHAQIAADCDILEALQALGDDRTAKALRHGDQRLQQHQAHLTALHTLYQTAIELKKIRAQRRQHVQAVIAAANIIECDAKTLAAQMIDHLDQSIDIGAALAFDDFKNQFLRTNAQGRQAGPGIAAQIERQQTVREDIDEERYMPGKQRPGLQGAELAGQVERFQPAGARR